MPSVGFVRGIHRISQSVMASLLAFGLRVLASLGLSGPLGVLYDQHFFEEAEEGSDDRERDSLGNKQHLAATS